MAFPSTHHQNPLPPPSSSHNNPRSRQEFEGFDPSALHSETSLASGPSDLILTTTTTTTTPSSSSSYPTWSDPPFDSDSSLMQKNSHRPRVSSLNTRDRALSSASSTSSSPVRRKPLPVTASPLATRYSSGEHLTSTTLELPAETFIRPYSVDSPTLYESPSTSTRPFSPAGISRQGTLKFSNEGALTSEHPSPEVSRNTQTFEPNGSNLTIPSQTPTTAVFSTPKHERLVSESAVTNTSESTGPWYSDSSSTTHSTMSIFSTKPTPPHHINISPHAPLSRSFSNDSHDSNATIQKAPKSPGGSKLGNFFGWGGSTSPASPTTTFSEKSISPLPPSPDIPENIITLPDASKSNGARNIPSAIDVPRANADTGRYFGTAHLQVPLATPTTPVQVEEMERELKDISAELAASIRREMDLEDLVERLQSEAQNPTSTASKRTSDYFSDSGTSSVKYGEPDSRQDELDRMLRKTEQAKGQMRLELTNKIQDERHRRKQLEGQVRRLEERASQVDLASMNSMDANGRLKDLEATCEDLRRRLTEERQVKDNFEDLLTALKGELQVSHNERDNLRDEIVPQLRARVEGLEAQAAEHEKLTYEQSKIQQELSSLKKENTTLVQAQRMQVDMQQQMKKFNTIVEESEPAQKRISIGLSRSNSVAAPRSRPPSLGRSVSVKTTESREALAERVKDVELQRDALHQALKSLLERQEHQNRENQKKIRQLEMERDKALSNSPRRLGYDKEVANLREEINTLRRRADDAIEQKWQCEKGLSGLKMDLDRAEQEISSLRTLLHENDVLVPTERRPSTGSRPGSSHANSESLERAYKDLQRAYGDSLERIKSLETTGPKDEDTLAAMQQLEQSLADAISERDFAHREAGSLREQAESLRASEMSHVGEEAVLADELRGSAKRVEELATQVRQQLSSNSTLRQRLSETIERGEKEQRTNAEKIVFMQSRLKLLEDKLMIAQQTSEDKVTHHEDEIRDLRESHNLQLQRMKDGLKSPRAFGPKSPATPLFANSSKAPRIISTTSGKAMTVSEDSKMEFLKQRVVELEAALTEADKEMEEVVSRMNIAQIEVMELQNEREAAVRETKRLQKRIEEERVRAFEGKFATLSS